MQDEGSKLLGGGRPLTIGDHDFIVRPVSLDGVFVFEEFARTQPLNHVLDLIDARAKSGTPVPESLAAMIVDAAVREGATMSAERISKLYYTTQGTAMLLWLHTCHMPGVTLASCREVVTEQNKLSIWLALCEVSAWVDPFEIKGRLAPETPRS